MKDLLHLTGRTYMVTGAASGIGRATSILLSEQGAKVVLVDINEDGLNETASLCVRDLTYILILDLTMPETFKGKILSCVKEIGKLNGFVHLAGMPYVSPLKTVTKEKCDLVYKVNTYAAVELAKIFTSKKVYAGEYGSIILISSVYGIVGSPANVGYALSKGAIVGMTKALAMEFAPKHIRVNCVAPGFIRTNMMDSVSKSFSSDYVNRLELLHPLGLGDAKDIANSILFLFSDMSSWVTGAVLNIDGGFTAQ